jgi:hypothetical protein
MRIWFHRYFHKIPFIHSETFPHDDPAPSRLCARGVTGRNVKGSSEHQCDAKRENSSDWHLSLLESEYHASPPHLLIARADQQLQSRLRLAHLRIQRRQPGRLVSVGILVAGSAPPIVGIATF